MIEIGECDINVINQLISSIFTLEVADVSVVEQGDHIEFMINSQRAKIHHLCFNREIQVVIAPFEIMQDYQGFYIDGYKTSDTFFFRKDIQDDMSNLLRIVLHEYSHFLLNYYDLTRKTLRKENRGCDFYARLLALNIEQYDFPVEQYAKYRHKTYTLLLQDIENFIKEFPIITCNKQHCMNVIDHITKPCTDCPLYNP